MTRWLVLAAFATLGVSVARAGQFDPPKPEVFLRAEDQRRAQSLMKPCTDADVGRGCSRYNGRASRDAPCAYRIDANTVGSLPTDQCYKMEKPRRYRGVWVDAFEGQEFLPEGRANPEWPRSDPQSPGFRAQMERARAARIWLNVDRVKLRHDFRNNGRRILIDFIGRKTMYSGWYGHMGMSGNEIIVDRVISLKPTK